VPALILLLLLGTITHFAEAEIPRQDRAEGFVGRQACAGCHGAQTQAWKNSHHDLAMQRVTPETVLGDFNNTRFDYADTTSRFFKRGEEYWINTDGPDGKLKDYQVQYVFGVAPLQQYLLTLPGGRLHALSIAWDARPAAQGGQRWYHLYPDDAIDHKDPLHWTGPYHTWNTRCAECHSTDLQKNFDPASGEFSTTWSELNVACEACHGPGRQHVALARTGKAGTSAAGGFPVDLAERGQWVFAEGASIAQRSKPLPQSQQVESCGRCHSRRGTLGEYRYGAPLLDTHRVSLLESPLYHADGQILDEVYVYGSFIQSKMYQAGVVCSNCHEPHSNELRAPGNGVCAQCHRADTYDSNKHHHHEAGTEGAACANCHMPETTYMGVDPRRDHSMRVPRPDLSVVIGTPNACSACHSDQNAEWALNQLRDWGVRFSDTSTHPARAIHQAGLGDARAAPRLTELAADISQTSILRASAMADLGAFPGRESYETAVQLLGDDDPMLRVAAVRALEFLPPQQLFRALGPHLEDPSTSVRMEIARVLADVPLDQLDPASAAQLRKLFDEYLSVLGQHADMPGIQLQVGTFFAAQQQPQAAEQAYRRALQINPQLLPALLNLADLYRAMGRDDEAREALLKAVAIAPREGAPHHALGLLETRAGNQALALQSLQQAAQLEESGVRYRYVYAIALHDSGQAPAAIDLLKELSRDAPDNPDLLMALATYCQGAGRISEARRYAQKLTELMPENAGFRQLYQSLQDTP
jgi:predicted CXXCH cytochrome family protein